MEKPKLTKEKLKQIFEPMNSKDRMQILHEIYPLVQQKLQSHKLKIPANTHQECVYVYSRATALGKISWRSLAKLYVVAESDPNELQHWCMKGKNLFRKKNYWRSNITGATHRSRRPSIYAWGGGVVPRTLLDKAYPKWVKTQSDYDRYMEQQSGMTKTQYQQQVLKMNVRSF